MQRAASQTTTSFRQATDYIRRLQLSTMPFMYDAACHSDTATAASQTTMSFRQVPNCIRRLRSSTVAFIYDAACQSDAAEGGYLSCNVQHAKQPCLSDQPRVLHPSSAAIDSPFSCTTQIDTCWCHTAGGDPFCNQHQTKQYTYAHWEKRILRLDYSRKYKTQGKDSDKLFVAIPHSRNPLRLVFGHRRHHPAFVPTNLHRHTLQRQPYPLGLWSPPAPSSLLLAELHPRC